MQLSSSDLLVLKCAKIQLSNSEAERLNDLLPTIKDWDEAVHKLIARGTGPLFYKKLNLLSNSDLIPEKSKEKLRQSYLKTLVRNMMLYEAFGKIAEKMSAADIHLIALKGIYLAEHLYKDIGLRQMSDIDLLINQKDGIECLSILQEMGYRTAGDSVSDMIRVQTGIVHFPEMVKDGISVEIHINLHWRKQYQLKTEDFINNSVPVIIFKCPVQTLAPEHLLIHLCIHLDKHYSIGELHHTCNLDIVNLIPSINSSESWDEIINNCKKYLCEEVVIRYLLLIYKFYEVELPVRIIESYQYLLTEKVVSDFTLYLTENKNKSNGVNTHILNLQHINGVNSKIRYFFEILFPPRSFMLKSYPVKKTTSLIYWYPFRWWIGFKGFIKLIIK